MVDRMVGGGGDTLVAGVAGVGLAGLDDAELLSLTHAIEVARRAGEAEQIGVLGEIERRALHTVDGHRGIDGFGRGVHRWSQREARARRALIRLGRAAPEVAGRLQRGELGVAQAHLLAVTYCHPRIGDLLLPALGGFLDDAAVMSFPQFDEAVGNWRQLVDQDGADPCKSMRDRAAVLGGA